MWGSNLRYILFQLPPSFPARQAFGSAELLDLIRHCVVKLGRVTEVDSEGMGGEGLGS